MTATAPVVDPQWMRHVLGRLVVGPQLQSVLVFDVAHDRAESEVAGEWHDCNCKHCDRRGTAFEPKSPDQFDATLKENIASVNRALHEAMCSGFCRPTYNGGGELLIEITTAGRNFCQRLRREGHRA